MSDVTETGSGRVESALRALTSEYSGGLERLHDRLERDAQRGALIDVAYTILDSPVGPLLLAATEAGLVRVAFESEGHDRVLESLAATLSPRILRSPPRLAVATRELDEYFGGYRRAFELSLDYALSHGFRQTVQRQLSNIGYGTTVSYKELAETVGNPKAVRAVGSACATNPLPIVVPCHRVLRSDGGLGGYLGGLAAKTTLLNLERAT